MTATTSTPNPADPVWSSSVPTEMPQVATQGEKRQSSQPASSVTPRTTLLSTNLPDTAPSILTQPNITLQQISKDSLRQVNSQSKTSKSPSTLGTRKRAYGEKTPPGKRPHFKNNSSTLGRDNGTTDELESEAESDSESVKKYSLVLPESGQSKRLKVFTKRKRLCAKHSRHQS